MSRRSIEMPPAGALTWPSSEVPGAEGDDGHAVLGADPHHVLDVGGLLRHHHAVRRLVDDPCGGMAVLLANGLRGDEAVAEPCGKLLQRACEGFRLNPRRIIGDGRTHGHSSRQKNRGKGHLTGQVKRPRA
ncbi:hypothetical protein ACVWXN_000790 [Bradyrhizobium sp. i1.4.4]